MAVEIKNRFTGKVIFTFAGADLRDANLSDADLSDADLSDADLRDADLSDADLRDADLRGANLRGADLSGADLRDANLRGAKNIPAIVAATTRIAADGDIVGWKKAGGKIVKLLIPSAAKRSNATGRKCRAEFVKVQEVEGGGVAVTDHYGPETKYREDEIVWADEWDDDRWNECSHGIHFFITREEAEAWR